MGIIKRLLPFLLAIATEPHDANQVQIASVEKNLDVLMGNLFSFPLASSPTYDLFSLCAVPSQAEAQCRTT